MLQVVGNATAGFIDARGAGAQHNGNALAAERLDRLFDVVFDLQRSVEQQLIVATALRAEFSRNCRQLATDRAEGD